MAAPRRRHPLGAHLQVKPKPGVEYLVFVRLFQAHFRREVLGIYGHRSTVCALRESPLLDGAHLVPDREEARPDPELVAHRWEAAREG